jgi:hypothetical protein
MVTMVIIVSMVIMFFDWLIICIFHWYITLPKRNIVIIIHPEFSKSEYNWLYIKYQIFLLHLCVLRFND